MVTMGVDEVGRGCWAGPVVAGAVILPAPITGLADSKVLTKAQRQSLASLIHNQAVVGLGWVAAATVDEIGLTKAVALAMEQAVQQVQVAYDEIIIDGNYNFLPTNLLARPVIKADATVPAVSAASIVAKVARDEYMSALAARLPGYGFERHVGYGTAQHRQALAQLGVTSEHRQSYRPVAALPT